MKATTAKATEDKGSKETTMTVMEDEIEVAKRVTTVIIARMMTHETGILRERNRKDHGMIGGTKNDEMKENDEEDEVEVIVEVSKPAR